MKKLSKFIYFLITLVFFIGANFYLSNLIVHEVSSGKNYSNSFMRLVFEKNTGAAFSILQNSTTFLIVLSIIALLFAIYYVIKNLESLYMKELFCTSILLSGIFGNLYERVHFGFVRDFFDLTFVNFPIFNISDVFINIGVLAIIVMILLSKRPIKL